MSIKGSPAANFSRALESGNLTVIRAAATELPTVDLADALVVCQLIRDAEPANYESAAVRWLARLCSERAVDLDDALVAAFAFQRLEEAPWALEALRALTKRPRRRSG